MLRVEYTGDSKILKKICAALNRKAELGETQETAYRGDRGKEAYEHSELKSGNPHNVTAADLGMSNVVSQLNAVMAAIGMIRYWATHKDEMIVDHDSSPIFFHRVDAEPERQKYILWH